MISEADPGSTSGREVRYRADARYSRIRLRLPIRLRPAAASRIKNTTASTLTQRSVPHPAEFSSLLASIGCCGVVCAAENAISSIQVGDA